MTWQGGDEYASGGGQVAHVQASSVRDDDPLGVRETQAQTAPVRTALLEWMKQLFAFPLLEAATFILNLDQDAVVRYSGSERHRRGRPGELHRVLEQVVDR